MNKNNNHELTYNQAKELLNETYNNNLNTEFGEEFAKKNNSNDEHSAKIKTDARKDNNVKKE